MRNFILLFVLIFLINISAQSQEDNTPKGFWKIPGTSNLLKMGGYVTKEHVMI